jgi:GMP synthase (glutamine-hydrolysing)
MSQIVIINTGGQYCHLISRKIREVGVHATVCSPSEVMNRLKGAKGIIISGGPRSVYELGAPTCPPELFRQGIPVLGICYGHQLMAHALGGSVGPGEKREFGDAQLRIESQDTILQGLRSVEPIWMSHGDEVQVPPPGFQLLATTARCRVAAMANLKNRLFGVQFHPEVAHTPCGKTVLENFVFKVCACQKDWSLRGRISELKRQICEQVGRRNVLFFVSGGVDSTVAFTLCAEAIGPDRVLGVFVNNGFMRKGEQAQIQEAFEARGWHNVRYVNRSDHFLNAVRNVSDPEKKRHLIGGCFLDVQDWVEKECGLDSGQWLLGQGTIYPDTIESGGGQTADVIKTHHNRVPAIEKLVLEGLVLEPLKAFYKDEVREIGRELGLPEEMVSKHPFPGPGLAVRCICSDSSFSVESSPRELRELTGDLGLDTAIVHLRTVGVQGDQRSYSNLVVLTGDADDLTTYAEAAVRITSQAKGTNRVAFLVAASQPTLQGATVLGNRFLERSRLDLLREADYIVQEMVKGADLTSSIWQFPVVLLPLSLSGGETVALRPVCSADAMTANFAHLPMGFIRDLGRRICKLPGIDCVLYDVTNKPPATIEWE